MPRIRQTLAEKAGKLYDVRLLDHTVMLSGHEFHVHLPHQPAPAAIRRGHHLYRSVAGPEQQNLTWIGLDRVLAAQLQVPVKQALQVFQDLLHK
jgi:hypothetical protein